MFKQDSEGNFIYGPSVTCGTCKGEFHNLEQGYYCFTKDIIYCRNCEMEIGHNLCSSMSAEHTHHLTIVKLEVYSDEKLFDRSPNNETNE